MGYETCYNLTVAQLRSQNPDGQPLFFAPQLVTVPPDVEQAVVAQLREENDEAAYAFDGSGSSLGHVRWYDAKSDLILFSQKYPDYVFVLGGEGDETGDLWLMYIYNGQVQECPATITYRPFDPMEIGVDTAAPGETVPPESDTSQLSKYFFVINYDDSGQESPFFVTTNDGSLSKTAAARYIAQEWGLELQEINPNDIHIIGPVFVDHLDCIE